MWGLAIVMVVAACGRFHFDPIGESITGDGDVDDGGDGGGGGDDSSVPGVQTQLSTTGRCADVAWSGFRAGVVWREGGPTGTADVMFAAVDATGAVVNGPFAVATALTNVDCPAIAWTGTNFIAAVPSGTLNNRDIAISVLGTTSAGALMTVVADSADSVSPDLTGAMGTVALVWHSKGGANSEVFVRPLASTGGPLSPAVRISGLTSSNGPPAVATRSAGFVVSWAAANGPHMRLLDSTGIASDVERVLSTGGTPHPNDRLGVAQRTDGFFALAWCAFAGNAVTTAVAGLTGTTTQGPFMFSAAASAQPAMVVDSASSSIGMLYNETSGLVQLHLATLDASGQVLADVGVASSTTDAHYGIDWTGTQFVIGYDRTMGVYVKFVAPP